MNALTERSASWHGEDPLPLHDARTLTQGGALARIDLDGQVYTLRITRAGKLILTK
jgi:hemin uptake protein HemP